MRNNVIRWAAVVMVPATAALAVVTASSPAQAAQTQAQKVCAAASAWFHHRTTANIDAMMADTFGGSWSGSVKYIVGDAASLYGDVRSGAAAKYTASDWKYLVSDCASA